MNLFGNKTPKIRNLKKGNISKNFQKTKNKEKLFFFQYIGHLSLEANLVNITYKKEISE